MGSFELAAAVRNQLQRRLMYSYKRKVLAEDKH